MRDYGQSIVAPFCCSFLLMLFLRFSPSHGLQCGHLLWLSLLRGLLGNTCSAVVSPRAAGEPLPWNQEHLKLAAQGSSWSPLIQATPASPLLPACLSVSWSLKEEGDKRFVWDKYRRIFSFFVYKIVVHPCVWSVPFPIFSLSLSNTSPQKKPEPNSPFPSHTRKFLSWQQYRDIAGLSLWGNRNETQQIPFFSFRQDKSGSLEKICTAFGSCTSVRFWLPYTRCPKWPNPALSWHSECRRLTVQTRR